MDDDGKGVSMSVRSQQRECEAIGPNGLPVSTRHERTKVEVNRNEQLGLEIRTKNTQFEDEVHVSSPGAQAFGRRLSIQNQDLSDDEDRTEVTAGSLTEVTH